MMWHILEPDPSTPGQYVSIDYTDTLELALRSLRGWSMRLGRDDLALAKGKNGEALHYVVYFRRKDERPQPVSAHHTTLGAKRGYRKWGRANWTDDVVEYGYDTVGHFW